MARFFESEIRFNFKRKNKDEGIDSVFYTPPYCSAKGGPVFN